ncbi:hypothetical protein SFC88_17940 [Nocardioides sp. HM23]|uniref:hypothetical protein n=1 Tax=Nocardioides bizhenqiangii TaxID=3095076 RepID=UPI002ACA4FEB|nr:hypothetical protein [Nocardioides sp. HM23]MDZ5622728.1 hypothetical protein [Nocardioides sp. HM23]
MPLRSTIIGAASGVVLLAGVVGFAVGLPEETEDQAADASSTPAAELIPESLLGGALVRYPEIDPQMQSVSDEVEQFGGDKLADVFDTDVAVGIYATPDLQVQVAVTVYNGESGLFLQKGPPVPPNLAASQQTISDIVRQGDSVCIAQWEAQAFEQEGPPFQTQCQRVVDGRTVNVYATPGLTIEQTAELVDDVVSQAGLD